MTILIKPKVRLSEGDEEIVTIDYTDILDEDEELSSVTVTVESGGEELTIDDEEINSSEITVRHRDIAANKAVRFTISGQLTGSTYVVNVIVETNSTPQRTLSRNFWFKGV